MKKSGKHEHKEKNKLGIHKHPDDDDDEIDFKIHFKGDGEFLPDLVVGKKTIKKINKGKKPSKKKDDDDDKKEMKKLIDEIDEELDKFNLTKEVIKRSSGTTPPIYIPTPSMTPSNLTIGGLRDYDRDIQQAQVRLREWFENRYNEPYQNILNVVEELQQRQQQQPTLTPSQSQEYLPPVAEEEDDDYQDLLDQLMPPQQPHPIPMPNVAEVIPFTGFDEPDEPPLFDPRRPPEQPQITPMPNLAEIQPPSQIPIYDFGADYEMIDYDRDIPSVPLGEDVEEEQKRKDKEQKKLMEQIAEDVEHIASPQLQPPQLTLEEAGEEYEDEEAPELVSTQALQQEEEEEQIEDEAPELVFADLVEEDIARKEEIDDKYAINRMRDDLRDTYGFPPHIIRSDTNTHRIMKLIERATIRTENSLSTSQNQDIIARVINEVLKENNKEGKAPNKDNLPTKLFLKRLTEAYEENVLQSVPYGVASFANITQPYQLLPSLAEEYGTAGEEIKKPSPRTDESMEELYALEEKRRENEHKIFEGNAEIEQNKQKIEVLLVKRDKEYVDLLYLEEEMVEVENVKQEVINHLAVINETIPFELERGQTLENIEQQIEHQQQIEQLQKDLAKYTDMLKELENNLKDINTQLKSKDDIEKIEHQIEVLLNENKGIEKAIDNIRKNMN